MLVFAQLRKLAIVQRNINKSTVPSDKKLCKQNAFKNLCPKTTALSNKAKLHKWYGECKSLNIKIINS